MPRPDTADKHCVVAVAYRPEQRAYFVVYDSASRGYAFPTRPWPKPQLADEIARQRACEAIALEAFADDVGCQPRDDAEAIYMDQVTLEGREPSAREPAAWTCHVVWVDPKVPLPSGRFGEAAGFLTWDRFQRSRLVAPAAREVLEQLLRDQHVDVAVVSRRGARGREFLMIPNRYGRWFFPAKRRGDYANGRKAVVAEFKVNADYPGRIEVHEPVDVEVEQETVHLGRRHYVFHLHPTEFPGLDLGLSGNLLEDALEKRNIYVRWFSEQDLRERPEVLSDTVVGVRDAVLRMPAAPSAKNAHPASPRHPSRRGGSEGSLGEE